MPPSPARHWPTVFQELEKEKFSANLGQVSDRENELLQALARSRDQEFTLGQFVRQPDYVYFRRLTEKRVLIRTGRGRYRLYHPLADVGVHFFGGDGIGRYGTGGLPVSTVRPDGTLSLLHSYQALGTVELHPHAKLDVYFNFGGEYASRNRYLSATGNPVGYGSPLFPNAGCSA